MKKVKLFYVLWLRKLFFKRRKGKRRLALIGPWEMEMIDCKKNVLEYQECFDDLKGLETLVLPSGEKP